MAYWRTFRILGVLSALLFLPLSGFTQPEILPPSYTADDRFNDDQFSMTRPDAEQVTALFLQIVDSLVAWSKSGNPSIRRCAIFALVNNPDPRALDALVAAVSDPQTDFSREGGASTWSELRIQAAQSLGKLKDKRAVPPLIAALGSTAPACQSAFAEALKEITGQDFGQDAEKWLEWWEKR